MFNFFKKNQKNIENDNAIPKKTGFEFLKSALSKTTNSLVNNVVSTISNEYPDTYELDDIEAMLIKADLGVDLAVELVDKIKQNRVKSSNLKDFLKNEFMSILDVENENQYLKFDKDKLNIYFVVGVNGAGKTTLIGKLAHRFRKEGNKVLLVAGDTFRAAAEEQLDIWSKRANVDILREDKADSASLSYRAIDMAQKEGYNVVIIDSAGRLQNKYNLIEELRKNKNVISKKIENIKDKVNLETILVLDGTQGQNGLSQAKVFQDAVDITSIAITKLDGSPRGGIIFSIAKNLKLPTKLVGIGEGIDDVMDFNKKDFIDALFE